MYVNSAVFRGRGRGLIEAENLEVSHRRVRREVFRGRGRGLIEARPKLVWFLIIVRWFSAAAAAASLKRTADTDADSFALGGFSAAAAAASLKQYGTPGTGTQGPRFSAAAAAASLKPVLRHTYPLPDLAVFRGRGRGLIEAFRGRDHRMHAAPGFPRPRPRPH